MIGRDGPVDRWELIRWARAQAGEQDLKPLEAHLLLVLATYCDENATCWPSIAKLAADCGLKLSPQGRNSTITRALAELAALQLVWPKQAGKGRATRRELLFNPASLPTGREAEEPSLPATREAQDTTLPGQPPARSGASLPPERAQKYQKNNQVGTDTTSTSEQPDEASRENGRLDPPTQESTDNDLPEAELVEELITRLADHHPELTAEQVRRLVERHQRAGTLDQFRPLVGDHHTEVTT